MVKNAKNLFMWIFVVILATTFFVSPVLADQANAQNAITIAQNSIKSCYDAASQAEAAGANIDSLIASLNSAAGLLSEAQLSYASGDYNSAYTYATQSQSQLNGFVSQATTLKEEAISKGSQNMVNTVLSIISSIGILSMVGVGWIVLTRIERRNLNRSTKV